jgi:phage-related protein
LFSYSFVQTAKINYQIKELIVSLKFEKADLNSLRENMSKHSAMHAFFNL